MSFLKKLLGLGGGVSSAPAADAAASVPTQEHQGFLIRATPYKDAGRFQLCGVISKEIDGIVKTHDFIRADTFATMDDAVEMTFFKARQIIDQQGDAVLR